ncbi:hypothetical protein DE146DRAFT_280270 [Phaeosphaeria sp. MPI-PUGE-AT-0046c]|nr:hypothetical protein DE146DRAFT_280270 [Phaeosphaeria sp. MPI-PUGE-AT-0046c]
MTARLEGDVTSNLNNIDADIAALADRSKVQREQLRVLEGNLELVRDLLGAGVELEVDDGLEMGDEMETFWFEVMDGDGDEENDEGEEEEEIDVEASNEHVWDWVEKCAYPEECLDA